MHGESGVGKSWLGDTVPGPRLVIDAEGRAKYTPSGPKVLWDPMRENPPAANGWQTCVVSLTDFNQLQMVYQWLRSGQHCFRSVVLDSIMEIQKRCIDQVAGVNQLNQQNWGEVLRKLEALVRSYRDLTMLPDNPVECVVMVCGTKDVDGTKRPLLQGQIATTLPYYIDVVGYLFTQLDETQTNVVRKLLVAPQPGFVAKDNTGTQLPGIIGGVGAPGTDATGNPSFAAIMEYMKANGKAEFVTLNTQGGNAA